MMAAENGHIEVVKMLLDKNANTEAVDEVSRNVIIACTALRLILIVIVIIILIITIIIYSAILIDIIIVIGFFLLSIL